MEQTPYNRSQEALDTHMSQCAVCEFINPMNPTEGLCDKGCALYRRLKYYAAGNIEQQQNTPSDGQGEGLKENWEATRTGQNPRRRAMDKEKKEHKPWTDTLPKFRMEQIVPAHWQVVNYEVINNIRKLIMAVRPADYRITPRVLQIDLSICTKEDHEARRKWLEEVIRLELLYVVDKL